MQSPAAGPASQAGVGVVVPHDFALDRELWRWVPAGVTLHLTRLPIVPLPVTVEMVTRLADADAVAAATGDLITVGPGVVAYACTSGSFIAGLAGEADLVAAMRRAGAPRAVTTSGAIVSALRGLGARRVAVATPYDGPITAGLDRFLGATGYEVVGTARLGLAGRIWEVPYEMTADMVRRTVEAGPDAVVVACTNLATYDLIAVLEAELGVPLVTANQATMWAAMRLTGRQPVGAGQRLCDPAPC